MEPQRVGLFDLDGSLADYHNRMMHHMKELQAPEEPPLPEDLWAAEEKYPHLTKRMWYIKSLPGFWRTLPRIEAGFDVYNLSEKIGFTNYILTKGPSNKDHAAAYAEKFLWCHDNIKNPRMNLSCDKGKQFGRFLYDDFEPYIRAWLEWRPRGIVIMPDTPFNRKFEHPNVVRYDGKNIAQVADVLQRVYDRKDGQPI